MRELRSVNSPFVDKIYTLYACDNCRSLAFDINQHVVDMQSIYEASANQTESVRTGKFRPSRTWRAEVNTISRLHGPGIQSVLDVGCRGGDFLAHWPEGIDKHGVELSEEGAAVARNRGIQVTQGYVEDTEFGRKFDVVTCYAVIEHLADPVGFLGRLGDLVEDDGLVVLMIPTYQCMKQAILTTFGRRWHMFSPPQHVNFFSRKHLDSVMAGRGFALLERRYTTGGMFNPFRPMPLLGRVFDRLMGILDLSSPLNRVPVFDHMYSYYRKL